MTTAAMSDAARLMKRLGQSTLNEKARAISAIASDTSERYTHNEGTAIVAWSETTSGCRSFGSVGSLIAI
jgi:hypothetical protein